MCKHFQTARKNLSFQSKRASVKADEFSNIEIKVEQKTREDRFAQEQEKCELIVHYLRHGKHLDGLTKNQQRVVRVQAKNYFVVKEVK